MGQSRTSSSCHLKTFTAAAKCFCRLPIEVESSLSPGAMPLHILAHQCTSSGSSRMIAPAPCAWQKLSSLVGCGSHCQQLDAEQNHEGFKFKVTREQQPCYCSCHPACPWAAATSKLSLDPCCVQPFCSMEPLPQRGSAVTDA